ncbi:hypothetical protein GCM10012319_16920 [Comamonas sp. KCTC 72670]|nr:hypothetical protein GCM10012319_16920 [Comamonas sp. KCTC 72670]
MRVLPLEAIPITLVEERAVSCDEHGVRHLHGALLHIMLESVEPGTLDARVLEGGHIPAVVKPIRR